MCKFSILQLYDFRYIDIIYGHFMSVLLNIFNKGMKTLIPNGSCFGFLLNTEINDILILGSSVQGEAFYCH